ncbi:LacI family transcriptional regulator [Spartobacteria bacterium LR76]|nr:LacI family transcriptional regulator [Spartobacteria bacterium LR76]
MITIMPSPARLSQVAQVAGVSAMTVSRVMRNAPHIRAATRQRVLQAVEALGYRPDPVASRLMAAVRKNKIRNSTAAIAFIRDQRPSSIAPVHRYVTREDVEARATVLGYSIDEFILGADGLTPRRLETILTARGIEAALFSIESPHRTLEGFDFSRFASATFGYGMQFPKLHRASTNMTQGLLNALEWLELRGYRRIGLAITSWTDIRSDHTYSGAMRHYQAGLPLRRRIPPLILPDSELTASRKRLLKWLKAYQPEALISLDRVVPDWAASVSPKIALLVHDHGGEACQLSGICHNRREVAAAAVDLVTTQLFHNERGIPPVPRQILIPATLIDQGSCPPVI